MNNGLDFSEKPTILVVDDSPDNLTLMRGVLSPHYRVKVANGGQKALAIAAANAPPDLILLDIMMPGMDGYEVCRRLKDNEATRQIPVIFLTAKSGVQDERLGFELGAVDYITKPVSPPIVLARVATQLNQHAMAGFLRDKSEFLEDEVKQRSTEVQAVQDATLGALASLAESRENGSVNHVRRTQQYVLALARQLSGHAGFAHFLTERNIALMDKAVPLHDIGKVGIPDRILLKPGPLDRAEYEIMKTHTTIGAEALDRAADDLARPVPFLMMAREMACWHQERWDGSGYPDGLAGTDIPISARLVAVADAYDALTGRRVYRNAVSHEAAVAAVVAGRGGQFDPDVVDAFVQIDQQFRGIAERFADTADDLRRQADQVHQALAEQVDASP